MSNKLVTKPLAIALGAAFATSLTGVSVANAAENPFGMTALSSGYMVADSHEGKCGAGKMESEDKSSMEGKCGEGVKKSAETMEEGDSGDAMQGDKMKEGKCGEAKCGANK